MKAKITAFLVLTVCHSWVASWRLSVIVVILLLDALAALIGKVNQPGVIPVPSPRFFHVIQADAQIHEGAPRRVNGGPMKRAVLFVLLLFGTLASAAPNPNDSSETGVDLLSSGHTSARSAFLHPSPA